MCEIFMMENVLYKIYNKFVIYVYNSTLLGNVFY
jgi:hypothetical protein